MRCVFFFFPFEWGLLYIFLGFYTLTVVPSFYLHIRYFIKNRGTVCRISPDRLCISKNGKEQIIERTDIEEIVICKSASIENGGIPITPMEAYFFVSIFDKAGNRYDLTCLLDKKIDKTIKLLGQVPTFVDRGFFNYV